MPVDPNSQFGRNLEIANKQQLELAKKKAVEDYQKSQATQAAQLAAQKAKNQQISNEYQKRFEKFAPEEIKSVSKVGPVELQKTLGMRESALQGYQAPELEAMRSQMAAGQQSAQQQRERALQAALAKQGIRGGAAAALQAQQGQMAAREKAGMDTEMLLRQAERQRGALGEYEGAATRGYEMAQQQAFQKMLPKLAAEQAAEAEKTRLSSIEEARLFQEGQQQAANKDSGGTVICTELYKQGLMSEEVYKADQLFGSIQDKEVLNGYHTLAYPVVDAMRASKLVLFVVHKIATPWANQMAYEMGLNIKPNIIGKLIMSVGLPICRLIGKLKFKKVRHGY